MSYRLEANGQFFDISAVCETPAKLKKELTRLKAIHQNEVKRIIERYRDSNPGRRYWNHKARRWVTQKTTVRITEIVPTFQPLKIQITKCY